MEFKLPFQCLEIHHTGVQYWSRRELERSYRLWSVSLEMGNHDTCQNNPLLHRPCKFLYEWGGWVCEGVLGDWIVLWISEYAQCIFGGACYSTHELHRCLLELCKITFSLKRGVRVGFPLLPFPLRAILSPRDTNKKLPFLIANHRSLAQNLPAFQIGRNCLDFYGWKDAVLRSSKWLEFQLYMSIQISRVKGGCTLPCCLLPGITDQGDQLQTHVWNGVALQRWSINGDMQLFDFEDQII